MQETDIMIYGTHSQFFAYLHLRWRQDTPSMSNFLIRLHGITSHREVIFMNIEFHIFCTWALHTGHQQIKTQAGNHAYTFYWNSYIHLCVAK